jgi:hypothetical protein
MTQIGTSGSRFVSLGVLLILLGFGVPLILGRAFGMEGHLTLAVALVGDGFRVGFFLGLGFLVIGLLRNRQSRKNGNPQP